MEKVNAIFFREMLFRLVSVRCLEMATSSEATPAAPSVPDYLRPGIEDAPWFNSAIERAENAIRIQLRHLIATAEHPRAPLLEQDEVPLEFGPPLEFWISLSHPLQEYTIGEAIQDALVALVCKEWMARRAPYIKVDIAEPLSHLKHISLMSEVRHSRPYKLN